MNRFLPLILALLLVVLLCPSPAKAQQTDSSTTDNPEAELREKAFAALESLANQMGSLQSPENRARIGANIAESLWKRDEQRARNLFHLVKDDIKLGIQSYKNATDSAQYLKVFVKLREDTLRRMARLDAELALDFLRETFPIVREAMSFPNGELRPEVAEREKSLELELARAFARENPEHALKLARKTLAEGFDEGLLMLLLQLSAKNKDDARVLYKEIVTRLAAIDLRNNEQALDFAGNLAQYFNPPAADDATFRELIDVLLKTALVAGCAGPQGPPVLCYRIGPLVPQMERLFPARATRLRRWASQFESEIGSRREMEYQFRQLPEDSTVDDVLAFVSRYPDMERQIYFHALRKAESMGDYERAQKIANEYKGDPETRQQLIDRVQGYGLDAAASQRLLDEIEKELDERPSTARVDVLLQVANYFSLHDPKTALKVLGRTRDVLDTLKPGKEHTRMRLGVAIVYCAAKSDQGFAMMEAMIPQLNELIAAGAKLDGYDTRYLRDGEWNMTAEGDLGFLLTMLARFAGYFAWQDFDRAMSLAAQFERGEIRMMAQLKLAQGILAGRPKRLGQRGAFYR